MVTWADVVAIAPQLIDIPLDVQTAILADATLLTSQDTWEEKYDLGIKYLAAHLGMLYIAGLKMIGPGGVVVGSPMPVEEEKVGEVLRKWSLPSNWAGSLDTTPYGLFYKEIAKRVLNAHLPLVC